MPCVVVQEDNNSRADMALAQESSGAGVGEDANGDADVLLQVLLFGGYGMLAAESYSSECGPSFIADQGFVNCCTLHRVHETWRPFL